MGPHQLPSHIIFFFKYFLNDEPIVFPRLFALVQVFVLASDFLLLSSESRKISQYPEQNSNLNVKPLSIQWITAISLISPFVSLISKKGWYQTGWWAIACIITVFVWILLRDIRSGIESVESLENLRYDVKGA